MRYRKHLSRFTKAICRGAMAFEKGERGGIWISSELSAGDENCITDTMTGI